MKFATVYRLWPERSFGLECKDKSLTVQSQTEDSDINVIWERYVKGADLPISQLRVPLEGDFADVTDYFGAQLAMRSVSETFDRLPAKIRNRFDNDAGKFFQFCTDWDNLPELEAMGFDVAAYKAPEEPAAPSTSGT